MSTSANPRAVLDDALRPAKSSAYPMGEYVGQESFMAATEILALAHAAGVGPGVEVLDVCSGVGGPGLFTTRTLGCRYVGVDASADAVALARGRASGLDCEFLVGDVPPLPAGRFEVVMLLETMLAFADKESLLGAVAGALPRGGRLAFTFEEGEPLAPAERRMMPRADTVQLVTLADMHALLDRTGFVIGHEAERTAAHAEVAGRLAHAYAAHAAEIGAVIGEASLADLLASHRLWSQWLCSGRARKFAVVAERR